MGRIIKPQFSFADLELQNLGIVLDPTLQTISDFLNQSEYLAEMVRDDLVRGLKKPDTGRQGLNPERVLRSFILQRIKNWDLRELSERIMDGYTLRIFTNFYMDPVPTHNAFHRAHKRLTPGTLQSINEGVVQIALQLGIEDGEKLRGDTSVIEANIHFPTDSGLLWDGVRVITRLVKRLDECLTEIELDFPDRCRRARRRMQEISRMTFPGRRKRPRQMKRKYRDLVELSEEVVEKAKNVIRKVANVKVPDVIQAIQIEALQADIVRFCENTEKVILQTRRRVFDGEQVPAEEKLVSIFETHTDIIKRGKANKPVEFGHKILLAETSKGLITDYQVLDGNPSDEIHVEALLQNHKNSFGKAPNVLATDRGFHSQDNVDLCKKEGVKLIAIPSRGGKKSPEQEAYEKTPAFKKAQKFRSGIEGRISVLFRGRGLKRCLLEGRVGFEILLGAAVLANNLIMIATHLNKKRTRPHKKRTRRRLRS